MTKKKKLFQIAILKHYSDTIRDCIKEGSYFLGVITLVGYIAIITTIAYLTNKGIQFYYHVKGMRIEVDTTNQLTNGFYYFMAFIVTLLIIVSMILELKKISTKT